MTMKKFKVEFVDGDGIAIAEVHEDDLRWDPKAARKAVHCVNLHDELVTALKAMVDQTVERGNGVYHQTTATHWYRPTSSCAGQGQRRRVVSVWALNRCDHCGLFRAWQDLVSVFVPDTEFTTINRVHLPPR